MAITKILNIMESEGRNPASHLKNALEYIQNPDKTSKPWPDIRARRSRNPTAKSGCR